MEYNKAISDPAIGDAIEGFYLLRSAQSKITSTGKPFLILTLADRTGAGEAQTLWLGGCSSAVLLWKRWKGRLGRRFPVWFTF